MANPSLALVVVLVLTFSVEGLRLNRKRFDKRAVEFNADAEGKVGDAKQELYTLISNRTCNRWGYQAVGASDECSDAAKYLGLGDIVARNSSSPFKPPGCYYRSESTKKLWFNSDGMHSPLATSERRVICRSASCLDLEEVKMNLRVLKSHKSDEHYRRCLEVFNGVDGIDCFTAREEAARALRNIGCRQTAPALISALRTDKETSVRYWAAEALGDMSGKEVLRALIAASREDLNSGVSGSAIYSLGKRRSRQALPALVAIAVRDKDRWLRGRAKDALKRIRSAEVVQRLLAVSEEEDLTSLHAIEALAAIAVHRKRKTGKELGPAFLKFLVNDKNEGVRGESAKVLGSLCDADLDTSSQTLNGLCTRAMVALKAVVDECPGIIIEKLRMHLTTGTNLVTEIEIDKLGWDKYNMCHSALFGVEYMTRGSEKVECELAREWC